MPHPALACVLRASRPVTLLRPVLLWLCCAGAWAEPAAEPLRVVTDYWPPFRMEGRDGRIEGLDIDLLEELQRRTGVQFEVRRQPWARALEDMRRRQADLMTGLARTAEREQYIDYLQPAYHACTAARSARRAFATTPSWLACASATCCNRPISSRSTPTRR